jgi:hypothetical protein
MIKKYNTSPVPTIITNDLYLAAFLHSTGCSLSKVERNERKRLSFVFSGERVRELREAYREGPVKLDMRSFRDSLLHIRHVMDAELGKRSVTHEPARELAAYPQQ